ncbi:MAG: SpoIIE family protein phosphatase [Candidatus Promineifilaceae bacterium]
MNQNGHDLNQKEILIVDDTPDNLRLLSKILAENGYRVRAATGGQRALDSACLAPPDLILLDIKMPGMDGFDTCAALKLDRKLREIPVLFISALDDVADKVRAFKTGGVDYITKPFQPEEVLARVETHLSLRDFQQRLERANCKMVQELNLAGKVQASFLPDKLPKAAGWEFAVTLMPARETSGDFYDVFTLPDGRLGILVADVVDKGVCAALFMALTYALMRSHAAEQGLEPSAVFRVVNDYILHDTHANQFVTVFYGILDAVTGRLVYSNAGHCPGLLISPSNGGGVRRLTITGMPLGIPEDGEWEQREVVLGAGDLLLLYTDGVIDAENEAVRPYGLERLASRAAGLMGKTAEAFKDGILSDIMQFAGNRPLFDDLVLFAVSRLW